MTIRIRAVSDKQVYRYLLEIASTMTDRWRGTYRDARQVFANNFGKVYPGISSEPFTLAGGPKYMFSETFHPSLLSNQRVCSKS